MGRTAWLGRPTRRLVVAALVVAAVAEWRIRMIAANERQLAATRAK